MKKRRPPFHWAESWWFIGVMYAIALFVLFFTKILPRLPS